MDSMEDFPSGFREWLATGWQRLAALDEDESGSEQVCQSLALKAELKAFRDECSALRRTARARLFHGSLAPEEHARIAALLHDLAWLLDVSPAAPPALVRQCLRIAQDRIAEDLAVEPGSRRLEHAPADEGCLELV